MCSAADDITNPSAVRILLEDLREIRKSKVRDGLQVLATRATAIKVWLTFCLLLACCLLLFAAFADSSPDTEIAKRAHHHGAERDSDLLSQVSGRVLSAHEIVCFPSLPD